MTIRVGRRPSGKIGVTDKRASIVGCDFPGCDKALEFPVNLQATDSQCKNDTIRFMLAHLGKTEVSGWVTNRHTFFCSRHKWALDKPGQGLILP